jgi:hypothetical protein
MVIVTQNGLGWMHQASPCASYYREGTGGRLDVQFSVIPPIARGLALRDVLALMHPMGGVCSSCFTFVTTGFWTEETNLVYRKAPNRPTWWLVRSYDSLFWCVAP